RYPEHIDESALPGLRAQAEELAAKHGVRTIPAAEARSWLADGERTTYLCDVRTPEEFKAGSLPGAVHAPGGQLIQATDQWVGVRNARIVLIDGSENVRAPVVASWLKQLGCDVWVLEGGIRSSLKGPAAATVALPSPGTISAADLKKMLDAGTCAVFDVGGSMRFRKAHIPGSRWSIRTRLAADARDGKLPVVLAGEEADVTRLAATELLEAGIKDVRLLDGGFAAWTKA